MRAQLLLLSWLFAFSGCGTALSYIPTREAPRPLAAHPMLDVDIFVTGKPDRPYVELGIIESQQEQASVDTEQTLMTKMREFAGERGCDGLVIFASNDVTTGGRAAAGRILKGYRGTCIVYTEPTPEYLIAPALAGPLRCIPNATQLCYGPAGCHGGQRCADDGKTFTPCDCGASELQPSAAASAALTHKPVTH